MTTAKGKNGQKFQNHLVTPENSVTAVCVLSGMHYHVSESLLAFLIPCFLTAISSTVRYSRYLGIYNLLDPVFSVYLVH